MYIYKYIFIHICKQTTNKHKKHNHTYIQVDINTYTYTDTENENENGIIKGESEQITIKRGHEKRIQIEIVCAKCALWYPNGYGNQALYSAVAKWIPVPEVKNNDHNDNDKDNKKSNNNNKSTDKGHVYSNPNSNFNELYKASISEEGNRIPSQDGSFVFRFGFRTIEKMTPELPAGRAFYFRINNIPIFMKGSNWIPSDSFQSRVNTSHLDYALKALHESNQNIIRNWGGGVYQRGKFFFCVCV